MKKTLLLACTFISFATISQAQITKGSILLGGSIGLSAGKTDASINEDSKTNSLNFSPTIGVAVKENWIVGINTSFSNYKADPTVSYPIKRKDESFSGGVFARRYSTIGKNFYLYGNGSLNYQKTSQSQISSTDYANHFTSKGVSLSIAPGIAYAINKRFHLEMSMNDLLSVGYIKTESEDVTLGGRKITESKSFGFETNLNPASSLYVGFRFVLGK